MEICTLVKLKNNNKITKRKISLSFYIYKDLSIKDLIGLSISKFNEEFDKNELKIRLKDHEENHFFYKIAINKDIECELEKKACEFNLNGEEFYF